MIAFLVVAVIVAYAFLFAIILLSGRSFEITGQWLSEVEARLQRLEGKR